MLYYSGGFIEGKIGNGYGYVEMDVLYQLWVDVCNKDLNIFLIYLCNFMFDCIDKLCCVKCFLVFGWMGVLLCIVDMKKMLYMMGKMLWNVSIDVLNLICEVMKVFIDVFWQFVNMSQFDVCKYLQQYGWVGGLCFV